MRALDLIDVAIIVLVGNNISLSDDTPLFCPAILEEPYVSLKKIVPVTERRAQLLNISVVLIQLKLSESKKYKKL